VSFGCVEAGDIAGIPAFAYFLAASIEISELRWPITPKAFWAMTISARAKPSEAKPPSSIIMVPIFCFAVSLNSSTAMVAPSTILFPRSR